MPRVRTRRNRRSRSALTPRAAERHPAPAEVVVTARGVQWLGLGRQREPVLPDQLDLDLPAALLGPRPFDGAPLSRFLSTQAPPLGDERRSLAEGVLLALEGLQRDHAGPM